MIAANSATRAAVLVLTLFGTGAAAQEASPRQQLKQLVERLKDAPDDNGLREEIIKLSLKVKPKPAIPENARKAFVEGSTFAKAAKDTKQQSLAVASFKEALASAPWWGDAYYNLAIAQELTEQFDDAESSLRLYLLTKPGAKEEREAQDRIYAIGVTLPPKTVPAKC